MMMMMMIALVIDNGTYLLIQDMNCGEGLLFSLDINFRLCQISDILGLRNEHMH